MKTNIAILTLTTLLISACSTAPKETTPPEAASTGAAATQTSQQEPTAGSGQASTADVSASDLATQIQDMQKKSVYFDFDNFSIKPEFHDVIQQQADFMKAHKNIAITLEGNADERGSPEYNLALGSKRANSVQKNLELLGVPRSQIQSASFGEEKPRLSCHEEKCWGENRRVDFSGKVSN